MPTHTSDIIVIGGGVIGLSTAHELAVRGYSVTLIEKDQPGFAASWASGGIISPLRPWTAHTVVDRLSSKSKTLYADFIKTISDKSGIDPEYRNHGMLIAGDANESDVTTWAQKSKTKIEILESSQIKKSFRLLVELKKAFFFQRFAK